jgi:hypothetical protein
VSGPRILFVTPSEVSSGEAVTVRHMALTLAAAGCDLRFLASAFTARLLADSFPGSVEQLGGDLGQNRRRWDEVVEGFAPEAVVFADYPFLFFENGTAPLADRGWVSGLERSRTALVTLDHLGYAQGPSTVFFGPPHLSLHSATFPELPEGMEVLLPCPCHDPSTLEGRRGVPFRYWASPGSRPRKAGDGLLVLHATPQWSWRLAEQFGLPYYRLLPSLLGRYLGDLDVPVTVVSVNNGALLPPSAHPDVRVVNLGPLPAPQYEELLLSCDLLLTENGVSVTMGKAVCAGVPCALLRNSFRLAELLERAAGWVRDVVLEMEAARLGSVFPYEVFPIWSREDVPLAGLLPGCAALEVFGGESTRHQLHRLLFDEEHRAARRAEQQAYADRVAALPAPDEALRSVLALAGT